MTKKGNKLLIVYPHGLGDCILLTPILREYFIQYGTRCSVVIMKRLANTDIFKHNPYVDQIFYCKDPWNDYKSCKKAFPDLLKYFEKFAKKNGFDNCILPVHQGHKIKHNAKAADVICLNTHTEIYTSSSDVIMAEYIIQQLVGKAPFGFIQTHTGIKGLTNIGHIKDLPKGFGKRYLAEQFGLTHFIEVGESFPTHQFNINVQFEILRRASAVCLPDSVFYHACGAMDKRVDYAYFGLGESVYEQVKPLHTVEQELHFMRPATAEYA